MQFDRNPDPDKLAAQLENATEQWRERRVQLTLLHMQQRELSRRIQEADKTEMEMWAELNKLRVSMQAIDQDRPTMPGENGPAEGMMVDPGPTKSVRW